MVHGGGLVVRKLVSMSALVLAVLCAVGCSMRASTPAAEPTSSSGTGQSADAAAQLYLQAADDLIATTRTQDSYQSTAMRELEPCKFAFEIAPGRQSILQFSFDVRQLNLNAVSAAVGQAAQSEFLARRVACAENQGLSVSYNGAPVDYVEIVSPTPEDLDRALGALRHQIRVPAGAPAGLKTVGIRRWRAFARASDQRQALSRW